MYSNRKEPVVTLTPLLIASAIACRSSFVFSGSWPATILLGFTDNDFPVANAENQNIIISCLTIKI